MNIKRLIVLLIIATLIFGGCIYFNVESIWLLIVLFVGAFIFECLDFAVAMKQAQDGTWGKRIGGAVGGLAGGGIPIPIVGNLIGKRFGETVGGAFDDNSHIREKLKRQFVLNLVGILLLACAFWAVTDFLSSGKVP